MRIGDRVLTRTHRTRELALQWARRTDDAARSGELVDEALARQTLTEYAENWIKARKLSPRTIVVYDDLLERRIGPKLGATQMRHLTPELVRRWWKDQPDGAYSAKAYRLLRSVCATAVDDGVLRRQPCRIENAGREVAHERPLLTADEIAALVEAAEPRARALLLLSGWCGLRRGELLGLERRHVNLLHRTITVEQSVQWLKGEGRVVLPPKSDAGRRTITMPAFVTAAVETHLSAYVDAAPMSPVAVGVSKRPASPRTLHRWWSDARTKVGLEHVHFHDLRHAAGTMAAWTGATSKEIQRHLGHASDAAARRYQHAAESRAHELADALDDLAAGRFQRRSRDMRAMGAPEPAPPQSG